MIFWPRAVRIPGQKFEGFTTILPGGWRERFHF